MKVPSSNGGNTLCRAAILLFNNVKLMAEKEYQYKMNYLPVASLTTDISVGLPKPDLSKIADTIFLYKLSKSSLVLALESVISLITGCKRDSRTRLCSSKNSA